jgi:NDP-sugar pyrophosphorylase family protein
MTDMPPLALLAGGLATRLGTLTEQVPKAMLTVGGEPFIAHQLRLLQRENIRRAVLCVGYRWQQIEAFVGDGSRFGLVVEYNVDGPELLGTGGALRAALDKLSDEFLIMYGDSWLDVPFAPIVDAFRNSGKPALMTVFRNDGKFDRSNVWFENGQILRYDKREILPEMRHIDWGLGIMKAKVIAAHPAKQRFDLADVYSELARSSDLAGFEMTTRFYEIGSAEGLRETDALLRGQAQS